MTTPISHARRPMRRLARSRRPPGKLRRSLVATLKRLPWWTISAIVHALILFVLAVWKLPASEIEVIGPIAVGFREPEPEPMPLDISSSVAPEPPAIEPRIQPPDIKEIVDRQALGELAKLAKSRVLAVQGPFGARTPGGRAAAVRSGGATEGSENAVELGLAWLARNQLGTGAWRTDRETARWADPGVTALATLAFLGAGYTHRSGKYARTVSRALNYLKRQQDRQGCIALTVEGKRVGGHMYCHAIATLALVEAFAMTKDGALREPAERAVDFICAAQNSTGGWRYYATSPDADSSVSGWMVMALRSASLAGLVVPAKAFDGARKFFDRVTNRRKGITYYLEFGDRTSPALIAVGLLCHQYLHTEPDEDYIAAAERRILSMPPKWATKSQLVPLRAIALVSATNNFYYWYYANMALHQRRDEAWEQWHPQVRELLIRIQERTGRNRGSWPPLSYGGSTAGRAYTTAMAILTLEVYYRYAPLFREVVDKVLAAYGDALAAYNHFARLHGKSDPQAEAARTTAIAKIEQFLEVSKPGEKTGSDVHRRRAQAARLLLQLFLAGEEFDRALALLDELPSAYPGALTEAEMVRAKADALRAKAAKLARSGQTAAARKAEAQAIALYYPLVASRPGADPELELWLADRFFKAGQWQKALRLYGTRVEGIDPRKLDPKSQKARELAGIYKRLVTCATNLRYYKTASYYLWALERLVGESFATQLQRADLYRKRKLFAQARRLYGNMLARLPRFSPQWWRARYEELLTAYQQGETDYVASSILKLEILHPDLGGPTLEPLFRRLLRSARQRRGHG